MFKKATALAALTILTGCTTAPQDIKASYSSPLQYRGLSCEMMQAEKLRLDQQVDATRKELDQAAAYDKGAAAAGVIFWPLLFSLGGTGKIEAEYGRLLGDQQAINGVMAEKGCKASESTAAMQPSAPVDK